MPDTLEPAPSGRAKCKGCGKVIEKAALRFGESVPNAFGEGEAKLWFHPACAACMRPEKFSELLKTYDGELPERAELGQFAEVGVAFPRLARISLVERASSGRARCRHCKELMDKGSWRIALQILEESRFQPMGFIHLSCAVAYFTPDGATAEAAPATQRSLLAADVLSRLSRFTPELKQPEVEEIGAILALA